MVVRRDSAAAVAPETREVQRFDRGTIARAQRTDEGFLVTTGVFARPGVLEYPQPDGSIWRELLLPEELHDPASLATLAHKPVTLEHPPVDVTPDNVQQYQVGTVGATYRILEDGSVEIPITVTHRDALDAIDAGTHEMSPGYKMILIIKAGTHPTYGRYDAKQTRRRYNHDAITEIARGGRVCRLRVDSSFSMIAETIGNGAPLHPALVALILAGLCTPHDEAHRADAAKAPADAKVDGVEDVIARCDAAGKVAILVGETAPGKLAPAVVAAIAKARADGVVEGKAAQRTDADLLAYANERAPLVALAGQHDVADVDKLGNDALRKAIAVKALPTARTDGTADYYRAVVDVLASADPWSALSQRADARTDGKVDERKPYVHPEVARINAARDERTGAAKQ
jgi:hypothetical protein